MKKFIEFCGELSRKDNIAIVHHSDADGISAGAIVSRAVFQITGKKPVFVIDFDYGDRMKETKIIEALAVKKVNKLIITDLGIDSPEQRFKKIDFLEKTLVIDHHAFATDMNSEKVIFLNVSFFSKKKPSQYPASKFCFDLFGKIIDLKDADWIPCIGIIGDSAQKQWKQFIQKTAKRNKVSVEKIKKLEHMVSAVSVVNKAMIPCLVEELADAKGISGCCKKEFFAIEKEFEKEKKQLLEQVSLQAKIVPEAELYLYRIKTKFPAIKSHIINEISVSMPKKTVILIEVTEHKARFSARRGDFKYPMNILLKRAIEGIPDSTAGGHVPAAAGRIPKQYLEKFEKNLVSEIQKMMKEKHNNKAIEN